MALTNKELQDILDNLTPEEQKQLYHQLSRNISNQQGLLLYQVWFSQLQEKWIYQHRYATIPM